MIKGGTWLVAKNPYNGFSPQQRTRAGQWYRKTKAAGLLIESPTCCTCGSPQRVNGHSEDYSAPYGAHIGAFDLCWLCHMMIHCRPRNPLAWGQYVGDVEGTGLAFPCRGLVFQRFAAQFLNARRFPYDDALPKIAEKTVLLSDIAKGRYNPNAGGERYWSPRFKVDHWELHKPRPLF